MPRIKNPGTIRTGSGQTLPTVADNLLLTGAGLPNVGQPEYSPSGFGTVHLGFPPGGGVGGGGSDLMAHVNDPVNAHASTAISHDSYSDLFYSNNVGGSLDELVSVLPPRPPMMGESAAFTTFSGIPDWGAAKLQDVEISILADVPTPANRFPYYWTAPSPTTDWEVPPVYVDRDPVTDPLWSGLDPLGLSGVPGSGLGLAGAGGFTDTLGHVRRTRGMPAIVQGMSVFPVPVTVSGSIFPADRGVVAILHWPKENTQVAFLAQDVLDRCVAAIVLGSGLATGGGSGGGGGCGADSCDGAPGSSGSLFAIGLNADGSYNPLAYPGRASGQYDLHEIHTGLSDIDGSPLEHPWDLGWTRAHNGIVTGAGQVRLGTEPAAGIPTLAYGIPILGAGSSAYSGPPVAATVSIHYQGNTLTPTYLGESLLLDTNFFKYRLPYLKDYSKATGLAYTPHGIDPYSTRETARYFDLGTAGTYAANVAAQVATATVPPHLLQAGNYPNFPEDYWAWQIARYRHTFLLHDSVTTGVDLGTYWMIHFKTEAAFEALVRDGTMPTASDVYGASLVDTSNVAGYSNLVNALSAGDAPFAPGKGVAPDYGYASKSYHVLRSSMVVVTDAPLAPSAVTANFTWALYVGWGIDTNKVTVVSGVSYFVPIGEGGNPIFWLSGMNLDVANAWEEFYRTEDNSLTGEAPPLAPARLSTPCPLFIGTAPFSYESVLMAGSEFPSGVFGGLAGRLQRLEVPFQYCGAFTDIVGPTPVDHLTVSSLDTGITFIGDLDHPAFATDAALVAYLRRPLMNPPIQPASANNGNGIRLEPTNDAGAKVLFHSTGWTPNDPTFGHYGNFVSTDPPRCDINLVTPLKDTEERFLDEIYRYSNLDSFGEPSVMAALVGPGMQGWNAGPIPMAVQAGQTSAMFLGWGWADLSVIQNGDNTSTLVGSEFLQVAGLPYRNPSYPNATIPFPSAGLLQYPKTDYTAGHAPAVPEGITQYNYTGCTGTRTHIRVFDASFARFASDPTTPSVPSVAGQPLAVVRIDGLHLEDFQYVAAGPGGLGDGVDDTRYTGIAIQVKVPGLTTWMDLGRVDGSGPSKQDPARDGAGCKVIGTHTFDGVDPITGSVYCQVEFNAGPWANLAQGVETSGGSGVYEVPVIVRVVMNALAKDYDLTLKYDSYPGQFIPVAKPGLQGYEIRGLCGIKIVHPTQVQTAP